VAVVAIDPSAAFRSAVRALLPKERVSVDNFHLVKLAKDMVTAVRRRVSWDRNDRRGRWKAGIRTQHWARRSRIQKLFIQSLAIHLAEGVFWIRCPSQVFVARNRSPS